MQPTQTLPTNYALAWNLDLKHNTRLNIILQAIGLVWMALCGWLFVICARWLRPDFAEMLRAGLSFDMLSNLLRLVAVMAVAILLHELTHGLFFWVFARKTPEFGIGPGYAFAAMPDWFFPKNQYLVVVLAPLLLLSGIGLALIALLPLAWLGLLLAGMTINAGGAIGDMYVAWRIAHESGPVWIKDTGDGFQLYRPEVESVIPSLESDS